jgi:hypothetical protein
MHYLALLLDGVILLGDQGDDHIFIDPELLRWLGRR